MTGQKGKLGVLPSGPCCPFFCSCWPDCSTLFFLPLLSLPFSFASPYTCFFSLFFSEGRRCLLERERVVKVTATNLPRCACFLFHLGALSPNGCDAVICSMENKVHRYPEFLKLHLSFIISHGRKSRWTSRLARFVSCPDFIVIWKKKNSGYKIEDKIGF